MAVYPVAFPVRLCPPPSMPVNSVIRSFDCVQRLRFLSMASRFLRCRPDGGHFRALVKAFHLGRVLPPTVRAAIAARSFLSRVTMFHAPYHVMSGLPFFFGRPFSIKPTLRPVRPIALFDFLLHCPPALRRIIRVDRHGFHGKLRSSLPSGKAPVIVSSRRLCRAIVPFKRASASFTESGCRCLHARYLLRPPGERHRLQKRGAGLIAHSIYPGTARMPLPLSRCPRLPLRRVLPPVRPP